MLVLYHLAFDGLFILRGGSLKGMVVDLMFALHTTTGLLIGFGIPELAVLQNPIWTVPDFSISLRDSVSLRGLDFEPWGDIFFQ